MKDSKVENSDFQELLDMDRVKIDPGLALNIPAKLARQRMILPFATLNGQVYVACKDITDSAALQAVQRYVKLPVKPEAAEPESLQRALDRIFGDQHRSTAGSQSARRSESYSYSRSQSFTGSYSHTGSIDIDQEDATVVSDEILHAALIRQASDIHIDPEEDEVIVRFRIDGVLEDYCKLPKSVHSGLISRLKVQGRMDIAEKRSAQDGRFSFDVGTSGKAVDIRCATLPTRHGERMTLRLLALQTEELTLERLGMNKHHLESVHRFLRQPYGMMLLTGPTGSGKSTTLYAAIRELLGRKSINIVTVEDPIEYDIKGVAQVEVDAVDKVTFSKALRSILRHDPDAVMIGEIRDEETAAIAVKASLTGHLVFSTLHTNSAVSAVTRLHDMGIRNYLIAATLRLVIAQRLVRSLCQHCRVPRKLTASEAELFGEDDRSGETVYDPGSCIYCGGKGFVGRIGLFEMISIDKNRADIISAGDGELGLREHNRNDGMSVLAHDALAKVLAGSTTVNEALAAVSFW